MPTAHPPIAHVSVAERAGSDAPSQDRIFTTPNAVIVLDGASQPDAPERDGGWLAQQIGAELADQLTQHPHGDLANSLYVAIAVIAGHFDLSPGQSPSTTVSIVRWSADTIDVLVLGDSPVIAHTHDGHIHLLRDDRLAQVGHRRTYEAAISTGGFAAGHVDQWRALVADQQAARNRPDGYWIAEATPEAAHQAVRAQWPSAHIAAVLVLTDGVADGVDTYRSPPDWPTAIAIAARNPAELVDLVHHTEETDPDGLRWPRSKRHDDKAAAFIRFPHRDPESGSR